MSKCAVSERKIFQKKEKDTFIRKNNSNQQSPCIGNLCLINLILDAKKFYGSI